MPSVLEAVLSRLAAADVSNSDGLVVGVSGGPDSQCLLDALARLQRRGHVGPIHAVGIDHGLRPGAGDELEHARELARRHDLGFTIERVCVDRRGNRLAAARRARLEALEGARLASGARFVVLAHTATDQVETVLMRLVRGSATRGLAGIPPLRGHLLRPLLDVPRHQVMRYLARRAIAFSVDPSNSDLSTTRAWLRERVLPELRHLNPALEVAVGRAAGALAADEALLEALARSHEQPSHDAAGCVLARELAQSPAIRTRVARAALERAGEPIREAALRPASGKIRSRQDVPLSLAPGATVRVPRLDSALHCALADLPGPPVSAVDAQRRARSFDGNTAVAFDVAGIHLPFVIRAAQLKERFRPFGSTGRTSVGDVLRDAGIGAERRRGWPVVIANGEIAWVVGVRRGSLAPIAATTRQIATVSLEGAASWRA